MPQTTSDFKHRLDSGEQVNLQTRWSFAGSAVQWFGNVSHQGRLIARLGGRVQLAAGTEPSAPNAVMVDVRRELRRRTAELDARIADLRKAAEQVEPTPSAKAGGAVDVELELTSGVAHGDLLWREFFGDRPIIEIDGKDHDRRGGQQNDDERDEAESLF